LYATLLKKIEQRWEVLKQGNQNADN